MWLTTGVTTAAGAVITYLTGSTGLVGKDNRMKTKTKLGLGFGGQVLLAAILGIYVLLSLTDVKQQFSFVAEHNAPVIANAKHLSKLVLDMETGQRGFCIVQKEEFLAPYISGAKEFEALIEEEKKLVSDNPSQIETLERVQQLVQEWQNKAAMPEIAMARKVATSIIDAQILQDTLRRGVGKELLDRFMALGHEIEVSFSGRGDWEGAFAVELIEKCMADRESGQRGFLITGKEEFLEKYAAGEQKKLPENFAKLRAIVSERGRGDELSEKINQLEQLTHVWTKEAAEPEIAARRKMNEHPESLKDVAALIEAGTGKALIDEIRREFDRFIAIEEVLAAESYNRASETTVATRNVAITFLVLALCLGIAVAVMISRAVSNPLLKLAQGAERVGRGDLNTRVEVGSSDEIGDLARVFNTMTVKLMETSSKHRQAEEALQESEEYHRDLFENSPTALYLQDFTAIEEQVKGLKAAGVSDLGSYLRANPEVAFQLSGAVAFTSVNQAAVDLYKAGSKRNLLGSLDQVIIKGDSQHFIDQVVTFTNGEDSWEGEARNYNFQKEIINIIIKKGVINRQENGISKVLVSINDVTELHKVHKSKELLRTQLHQAQKMESIGTLAGGIAHNFNNLLMGIQGNASMVLLDIDSSNPRHKNLKYIEKLVENGAKLTAQLIGYAREGSYEVKPTSLNQLIKETSDTFGMTKKEILIHQELSEKLYGIKADQGQIEQVLLNLYVNAADAMPEGGDLFLKTINVTDKDITGKLYKVQPGNYVFLSVRDTGGGMDKETRERIFEPFFTTKGLASGTGLGMASAYGTIKGHGGYIDVDSEKGKGTTFSIYLPATEKVIEEKKVLSDELVKGKGTVLLVDDEEMVLEAGKELLTHLGYEVLLAENGREALELYKKNHDKIDLVLLDMVMPVMGGGEAFDRMKEINTNVKVLLSSGYSLEGEAKEILKRGCDAFIQKPFKMEQLSQKLMEVLDKK